MFFCKISNCAFGCQKKKSEKLISSFNFTDEPDHNESKNVEQRPVDAKIRPASELPKRSASVTNGDFANLRAKFEQNGPSQCSKGNCYLLKIIL